MNNPIFLLSTGRTGTKFFSQFFVRYADAVSSYHTTKFTRLINVLGNLYIMGFLPDLIISRVWKLLKYEFIASHIDRYIENNPFYYAISEIILRFFPHSKFIVVIRSPKSYVLSHIKKEQQNIRSKIANCLVPFWQPVSYLEHVKGMFGDFYQRVEFYAHVWNYKNSILLKAINDKKRYFFIKFEDIFDLEKGPVVLNSLIDWLKLSPSKRVDVEAIKLKINQSNPDERFRWDEICQKLIESHCGELMNKLNGII